MIDDDLSFAGTEGNVLAFRGPANNVAGGDASNVVSSGKGGVTRVAPEDVPVAITGIVPVKVTAGNGAILPGDLLVSSRLPGRAMKAGPNPRAGTVLGKALGALRYGDGVIKVLVMLR